MKPAPAQLVIAWVETNEAEIFLPSTAIAEIAMGIESIRPAERSRLLEQRFHAILRKNGSRILPFDSEAALLYGQIVGRAKRMGRQIDQSDGMIAATALRNAAAVATRNVSHFQGLGFEVLNPWLGTV